MRLVAEDLALEGDPGRNLATFVTTWMEPEAQRIIADEPAPQLHRPRRVPAHGRDRAALHPDARRPVPRPGRDDRGADPGLVRGDHARRPVAEVELAHASTGRGRRPRTSPNLVFGGDVHVVWEKFCRYFDVEPRIVPLQPGKYTIGPEDVGAARRREHDRGGGRAGHDVHRAQGRHRRHQRPARADQAGAGPRRAAARRRRQRRLRVAVPLPGLAVGLPARAGALDQRLGAQVRPGLPGHRLADLPGGRRPGPDLVFKENYLGKTDSTFTLELLDRLGDGAGAVLQPRALRPRGLHLHHAQHAGERSRARRPARGRWAGSS